MKLDVIHTSHSILDNLGEGVIIIEREGKFQYFNKKAEDILGIGATDVSPHEWSQVYGCYKTDQVTPYPSNQLPLARSLRGETVIDEVLFIKNDKQINGVWISVTCNPIKDPDGTILGGVMIIRDITETRLARDKVARLAMAVEQTADGVIITNQQGIIEYVNPGFEVISGFSREEAYGNTPRLLKSGHHDDAFYRKLWDHISSGKHFRATVLNKKKNGDLFWVEQTITPLTDESNQITHYVSVIKDITELREKHEQDFQLDIARKIQQQFYPDVLNLPGLELAGNVYPADETGGDYYDFIQTPDNQLWFVIGDVADHGIGSALIMAETHAYVDAFVGLESDPGAVLEKINQKFTRNPKNRFVTMLLARLDQDRSLVYANAGQIPAYLLDSHGGVKATLNNNAIPLGSLPDWKYNTHSPIKISKGDLLLFITDGAIEAEDAHGNQFGVERILEIVKENRNKSAQEIIKRTHQAIDSFSGNRHQQDDITLMVCKFTQSND